MSVFKEIASDIYQWSEFSSEKQLNFNGYYLAYLSESVIIDPPFLSDDGLKDLQNLIKKKSDSPLKAVLLTNVHHDRMCQKLKEVFGIPVYIHENDADALDFLIKKVGENKIALGTDYPFPLGELEPGNLIESSNYSDQKKNKLLFENALDWLGLSHDHFK